MTTRESPERTPSDIQDLLNTDSAPTTFWTTVNAAEALPGTVTPLTWSLYRTVAELGTRGAFADMGILREDEVAFPPAADERFIGLFYGQCAINVDRFRAIADRTPGQSGDGFEQQLFGTARSLAGTRPDRSRYAAIAVKAPRAAFRAGRRLEALHAEAHSWWHRRCGPAGLADGSTPSETFDEARALFTRIMRPHVGGSMFASGVVMRLSALVAAAGQPGLETRLLTGHGSMAETKVLRDLWAVSRDGFQLDDFRSVHGFHGPNEGELLSRSWREDPTPLHQLVSTYRSMPAERAPDRIEVARRAEAAQAEDLLLRSLSRSRRPAAATLLRIARHFVPLRELGRSAFLRALDGGRAAARAAGDDLCARGVLDHCDDAFFLTAEELFEATPANAAEIAADRRARFDSYLGLELPESWSGNPTPVTRSMPDVLDGADTVVQGLGVSPGVVEARVRVVLSPDRADDLEPGEVLVCPFTDPGWASLFLIAGALVIDVGGALSHGAIVARELGVPCVINTRVGTSVLRTGDLVSVDASVGTVRRVSPAST